MPLGAREPSGRRAPDAALEPPPPLPAPRAAGRASPVMHMAGIAAQTYQWQRPGVLISPYGHVPAVVHQFDRHPALYFYYYALYNLSAPWRPSMQRHVCARATRGEAGHLGLAHTETQRGRLWTA